jgi:hypothetical protein
VWKLLAWLLVVPTLSMHTSSPQLCDANVVFERGAEGVLVATYVHHGRYAVFAEGFGLFDRGDVGMAVDEVGEQYAPLPSMVTSTFGRPMTIVWFLMNTVLGSLIQLPSNIGSGAAIFRLW